MELSRRDFVSASSALAAAFGLKAWEGFDNEALGAEPPPPSVVWLQGQSCSGCSISLLNSIYYMTVDNLLLKTVTADYHPTLMAPAGPNAINVAKAALSRGGYILVVEGAIPTGGTGRYCTLWPGKTMLAGVQEFAQKAAYVIAVGTCSSYGGISAGTPNPTGARSLGACVGVSRVLNLPGCPTHPDWVVGTIAYILANNRLPEVDSLRRPKTFFSQPVHERCPYEDDEGEGRCLLRYGCKGKKTRGDCPSRKFNGSAANTAGVNWCVLAGAPCQGCTEPGFPDSMSPFYTFNTTRSSGD